MRNDIALIGLGVMGSNLSLNIADHGYKIAVYNYTSDLVEKFVRETPHPNAEPFTDLKEMVKSLKRPRRIIIMVTAGAAVDAVIGSLKPLLEPGDIVMDLGNSFFEDTMRRFEDLKKLDLIFTGVGVSGGSEGARHGPAIMAGGTAEGYQSIGPILEAVSAKAADGEPCCGFMGQGGAGHYVKMVHNGIEYADMQLIAESYLLLKKLGGFDNLELSDIYRRYNLGPLQSYLIKITSAVLAEADPEGPGQLIDKIKDVAGQKGTGKWTCMSGFEVGVGISLINEACNARFLSGKYEERQERAQALKGNESPALPIIDKEALISMVEHYIYVGKIAAYAQGFELYKKASDLYGFDLDLGKIAKIFRAGCIIQAQFLNDITQAYKDDPELPNLIDAPFFKEKLEQCLPDARRCAMLALEHKIPNAVMLSAISYLDAMSSSCVGANLIQGLRDYFGAHTFERNDDDKGFRHHNWQQAL